MLSLVYGPTLRVLNNCLLYRNLRDVDVNGGWRAEGSPQEGPYSSSFFLFFFFFQYLFTCGTQDLLVVVCELLVVACGI